MANTTKTTPSKGIWSTIKRAAKEHHQSVNSAYSTFYGMGTAGISSQSSSRTNSARTTPATSQAASPHASPRSSAEHNKRTRAHHESLNASVWGLYGASNAR
ncbi:hypothetical protein PG993_005564 [Apiospora rasikravindrae]|uniref:Uncharacterized protein n=1 Tax=Apiospora rasikravindrae TaxID=990691 RepID=A0ABR1TFX6_9PEZI